MKMVARFRDFICERLFVVSRQPVILRDLLEANALFNEGMMIDPAKLKFRFNKGALYGFYAAFCVVVLLVATAILHRALENIDFHFSVIGTAVVTAGIFAGFDAFRMWARRQMSLAQIKAAWAVHFPFFAYEKYSKKVEEIYNEAQKDEVSKKDLEKYVLERLVATAG